MASGRRDSAAVSRDDTVGVSPVTQAPGFQKHAIKMSGSVNELTDVTVCSVDGAMRGAMAHYLEFRFRRSCQ
jgi:hypothetical protein